MNKTKLKNYAPQARKDFIAAVSARANQLGLSASGSALVVSPATRQGDVTLIEGRDWPAKVYGQRERLVKRMQRDGFDQTVEAVAYTWFNRFAALRYMELHDYLEHGYRVLSSIGNEGGAAATPDILLHAVDLAQSQNLPGLNADEVGRLKLAGNQDGELYRKLLIAQCNALSNAMPFLFERIDDETELLLPDNLLRTDSVIAKLVSEIPEEDWQEVEVIGWLYQFYISEKKDQVIGKVVKSEDIPAATQLFTPNWIVKYMVQNSVGRLWMMANPDSSLKSQWEYYIEPAEQTPEVNAQLDALIKTRMDEDGGSLNPETITVLDPACGSGHILVEAYELLKGIYLERGYRLRDIPRLILEKNLYGLDIDDRAAQMAGFALLMKARADDRRLLNESPKLNVLSLQESKGLDLNELSTHLAPFGIQRGTVKSLIETFEHAKTFGSLIQVSEALDGKLVELGNGLRQALERGDLYAKAAVQDLMPLLGQAIVLAMKFDAVVANPPYMGNKGMNEPLKEIAKYRFPNSKSDVFAMFIEVCLSYAKDTGNVAFVTPYVWMFISSYEDIRSSLISNSTMHSLIQLEYNAFEPACVPVCCASFSKNHTPKYVASYVKLSDFTGHENQAPRTLEAIRNRNCGWFYEAAPDDFRKIPGAPIAYWISNKVRNAFSENAKIGTVAQKITKGIFTGDNGRFIREWHEVSSLDPRWVIYSKGGAVRKWYGNTAYKILWEAGKGKLSKFEGAGLGASKYFGKPHFVWSKLTSSNASFRYDDDNVFFDDCSPAIVMGEPDFSILSLLNSKVAALMIKLINPTLNYQSGDIQKLPIITDLPKDQVQTLSMNAVACVEIARRDWDDFETSWGFTKFPFCGESSLETGWVSWRNIVDDRVDKVRYYEEINNKILIQAYGLNSELNPDVPEDQITLARADREKDSQRLISYVIGCTMGRYSLDEPGLIYAHSGNEGFDETRYKTFPADADGIVPITDELWFEDDAANRVREFVRVVWGAETLEENMAWLAESLGKKDSETPDEAIRRYCSDKFFKDHLQTYKKRPIYWLFSSGKQGAFQALVYLHRYHEGTLARMRAEYVVPLTGKMQSRIEMLEKDAESASSTAARNKINKEIEKLRKKHVELLAYDEKLRHYADMRIKLDLDDGVKVNYGKFGDLLDSVKAITGGSDD